jgi:hypothetical protein
MDLKITIPKSDINYINLTLSNKELTPMTNQQIETYISEFTTLESIHKQSFYIQNMMILEEQSLLRLISPQEHRQKIIHLNQKFKALIMLKEKWYRQVRIIVGQYQEK